MSKNLTRTQLEVIKRLNNGETMRNVGEYCYFDYDNRKISWVTINILIDLNLILKKGCYIKLTESGKAVKDD